MNDIQTRLTYVKEAYIGNTGGGILVDVLVLNDDTVLAIGSDGISLHRDMEHYLDNSADSVFDFERVEPELTIYSDEIKQLTKTNTSEAHHSLRVNVIARE